MTGIFYISIISFASHLIKSGMYINVDLHNPTNYYKHNYFIFGPLFREFFTFTRTNCLAHCIARSVVCLLSN